MPAPAPRRNVELKACDPDPAHALAAALALGAADHGVVEQRDTYFHVARGALKLREEQPGAPHLIHYERADGPGQRESSYRLVPVADAPALDAALAITDDRLVAVGYAGLLGL